MLSSVGPINEHGCGSPFELVIYHCLRFLTDYILNQLTNLSLGSSLSCVLSLGLSLTAHKSYDNDGCYQNNISEQI